MVFSEENVWHLAKSILELNKSVTDLKCYVIALSNSKKCVHLWKQIMKSNDYDDGLLFWVNKMLINICPVLFSTLCCYYIIEMNLRMVHWFQV